MEKKIPVSFGLFLTICATVIVTQCLFGTLFGNTFDWIHVLFDAGLTLVFLTALFVGAIIENHRAQKEEYRSVFYDHKNPQE